MSVSRSRLLASAALCLCAIAGISAAPASPTAAAPTQVRPAPAFRFALPEPGGPYSIGAVELHLVDRDRPDPWVAGRDRELMVTVWYPAIQEDGEQAPYLSPAVAAHLDRLASTQFGLVSGQVDYAGVRSHARAGAPARDQGRRPVVLYSPGRGNPRHLGTTLVEDLASRGYVVVSMDHTYEAPVEFPDGRVTGAALPGPEFSPAVHRKMIEARVEDTRFVLDQLAGLAIGTMSDASGRGLPRGLGRVLDLRRVGMFGHSAGGFTAAEAMLADARIDAAANLDGSMIYSLKDGEYGEAVRRGLDRGFMLMGAGLTDALPHTHRHAVEWKLLWERSTGRKLDVYMAEGEHWSYSDLQSILPQLDRKFDVPDQVVTATIGIVDPIRSLRTQRAYLGAFFDERLRGTYQPLLHRTSPRHPDVELIR